MTWRAYVGRVSLRVTRTGTIAKLTRLHFELPAISFTPLRVVAVGYRWPGALRQSVPFRPRQRRCTRSLRVIFGASMRSVFSVLRVVCWWPVRVWWRRVGQMLFQHGGRVHTVRAVRSSWLDATAVSERSLGFDCGKLRYHESWRAFLPAVSVNVTSRSCGDIHELTVHFKEVGPGAHRTNR
jgi:hypothetical protein